MTLIWTTGCYRLEVVGSDQEDCWEKLGKMLKGECLSWNAELEYKDDDNETTLTLRLETV